MEIEIRVLGPLEVLVGGAPAALGGPRQRAVLAMLVAGRGRVVPVGRIVEQLWDGTPPPQPLVSLQAYISRLRKVIEPGRSPRGAASVLVREPSGYALRLPDDAVDAWCLEKEVRGLEPEVAGARDQDPQAALGTLRRALPRWRGEPFEEFADQPWAGPEIARLREVHLAGQLREITCLLQLGHTGDAIPAVQDLAEAHPLRGEVWWLYALGLWAAQRSVEALDVLRRHRKTLAAELGSEPSPALLELEQAILSQCREVLARHLGHDERAATDVFVAPAQLPHTAATFAAREAELAELDRHDGLVVITGPGGAGKTTLAVRWAHQAAGRYPDGQLYAGLRGFGPEDSPALPTDVLFGFLTALGVPDHRVPPGEAERAALFRGVLAGRRMLIVLDNAHDAAQVRPLLPGTAGCTVVVTSRDRLDGIGAHLVRLDGFRAEEARAYLRHQLGAAVVDAEPAAVDAVLARCGGLPLALAVVCARVVNNRSMRAVVHRMSTGTDLPLASIVAELAEEEGLDAFTGPGYDLRGVFSWSYRRLPADAAELFRLLALHPGPDLPLPAAASVAGRDHDTTRALLRVLCDAHLLAERQPGRYAYHDLVRSYALEIDAPGRETGLRRLVEHHLHSVDNAARAFLTYSRPDRVGPPPPDVSPVTFTGADEAVAWLHAEYDNVLAVTGLCGRAWGERYLGRFVWALSPYQQDVRFAMDDSFALARRALAAAERAGDTWWTAFLSYLIARGHLRLDQREPARPYLERTIAVARATGDDGRLGLGLIGMTIVLMGDNRTPGRAEAEAAYPYAVEAIECYRRVEDSEVDVARALTPVAWHRFHQGDATGAARVLDEALAVHRRYDDSQGAADTLVNTGLLRHAAGDPAGAVTAFAEALGLIGETPELRIQALAGLYQVHRDTGDTAGARRVREEALALAEQARYYDVERLRAALEGGHR